MSHGHRTVSAAKTELVSCQNWDKHGFPHPDTALDTGLLHLTVMLLMMILTGMMTLVTLYISDVSSQPNDVDMTTELVSSVWCLGHLHI